MTPIRWVLLVFVVVVAVGCVFGLVRLTVFMRRFREVSELKDAMGCLLERAVAAPSRVDMAQRILLVTRQPRVLTALSHLVAEAKMVLRVDHSEINLMVAEGNIFVAGDTITPSDEARPDSYCQLTVGGQPIIIRDSFASLLVADNPYAPVVRSYMGVPLIAEDEVVGSVCAYGAKPRDWTADEEKYLTTLGQDVSILLVNAVADA